MINAAEIETDNESPAQPPRVYLETYGCSFNVSDGEVMTGLLERDGFLIADSPENADAVIVNSCTVKDRTWLELRKRLERLDQEAPAVILAGCAPRIPSQSKQLAQWSQIGPNNLADIPNAVRQTLAGRTVDYTGVRHDDQRLMMPARRRNPHVEIVPISKGCLGSCTFCQTVIARGRLRSFPVDQIVNRIAAATAEGVNQIWLTSQDCGAYGLDIGTNLPGLMRRIAEMTGDFVVRVGMANPDLINLYLDEFAAILANPRFYQFAHIPLQAGSDSVLKDMRRLYAIKDFYNICERLRAASPDITIATDIIVGFPTESDADFDRTLAVINDLAIPVINRSKFSPRPGTPAARLDLLPSKTVSQRSRELYRVACEVAFDDLDKWNGWRGAVTLEEKLKHGDQFLARNFAYKPVILPAQSGVRTLARVSRRERFHLIGEPVIGN